MEKNNIFQFTAPNEAVVTAVVIGVIKEADGPFVNILICYAQNKIFTYIENIKAGWETKWKETLRYSYGEVLVNHAILPDYDSLLEDYQHLLDMADDYASREH